MRKRKWKRWVLIGKLSLKELADVARENGMRIICGFKVPMCVHNQIGLYGTSAQMKATGRAWAGHGHKITNRQPSYAFSISVDKHKTEWIDKGGEE